MVEEGEELGATELEGAKLGSKLARLRRESCSLRAALRAARRRLRRSRPGRAASAREPPLLNELPLLKERGRP